MRVLCLHLPNWPAQRVRAAASADSGRPVVVHAPVRNLPRVVALTAAAAKRGVAAGMPLAEAEALLDGEPLVASLDAAGDLDELKRLAGACGRFGPVVGIEDGDRPESLLIDVTGCAPFFRGEESLAREAVALLAGRRYAARGGLADTVGLAWAASRAIGRERFVIVPAGGGEAWLSRRPVVALRLDPKTLATLAGLGLRSVGDVLRLPRAELPSRFGPLLLRRIGQALGSVPESIEPVRPPVPLAVRWSGEVPLTDRVAVAAMLTRLVGRLVARLPVWDGVTALTVEFDGRPLVVRSASPARSADRLASLVALALDREPPPREVGRIVVTAETTRLPPPDRTDLFGDRTDAENERLFRRLVERLAGRLGEDAVTRPALAAELLPERSVKALPIAGPVPPTPKPKNVEAVASRPILLLLDPEPVQVLAVYPDGPPHRLTRGRRTNPLVTALGPERVEAAWAGGPEARRDYWRVETDDAERLWLYRCRRSGDWFLHGLFG